MAYKTKKAARAAEKKKDKAGRAKWVSKNKKAKSVQNHEYKPKSLKIAKDGKTNDVRASWVFKKAKTSHIDSFEVDWEISNTRKKWKSDGVETVSPDDRASGTFQATHNVSSDWHYIRCRVRPKAEKRTVTATVTNYKVEKVTKRYKKDKKWHTKTSYKLVKDTDSKSKDYYWFGGVDGYGAWTGYKSIVNPEWTAAASEEKKEESEKVNGKPEAATDLSVEYVPASSGTGSWHVTWSYPSDDHKIDSVVVSESTNRGKTWSKLKKWGDRKHKSIYRREAFGTKVMFRVRISTASKHTDIISGEYAATPTRPSISRVYEDASSVVVMLSMDGNSGDTVEIDWAQSLLAVGEVDTADTVNKATFDYEVVGATTRAFIVQKPSESGIWYYTARVKSDVGWSYQAFPKSISIGSTAEPPTPVSPQSGSSFIVGDTVRIEWKHNCADGSAQTAANVDLTVGDKDSSVDLTTDEHYDLDTSSIAGGTTVYWRVKTAGANGKYGGYCAEQAFTVYEKPSVSASLTDGSGTSVGDSLSALPLGVTAYVYAANQKVVEWTVTLKAAEAVEVTDSFGDDMPLAAGTELYRRRIALGDDGYDAASINIAISAVDADWPASAPVTLEVSAFMDSGLEADSADIPFECDLEGDDDITVTGIAVPGPTWTALITPSVYDADGNLSTSHTVSVYRIDDDGYTEIGTDLANDEPQLVDDYPYFGTCQYRIVANNMSTDRMTSATISCEIDEECILIQWGDTTIYSGDDSGDDETDEDSEAEAITADYVELPYNIEIEEQRSKDVSLKRYIGRKHEVSYYGTLVTQSGNWRAVISADEDAFVLQQLRELGNYMGDVYVREPTGSGYWAHVDVSSLSSSYSSMQQSVSLSVTRVDD